MTPSKVEIHSPSDNTKPSPGSQIYLKVLLNKIANKWLEDKKSAYSKDFGTFVGRMSPRAHQISGLVSKKKSLRKQFE